MNKSVALIGWNDKRAGRDFPKNFDNMETSLQLSYEIGRQLAVINKSINACPKNHLDTLYDVATRNGSMN